MSRITEKGAETVLMWNTDFYNEFCPQVFSAEGCVPGYHHLKAVYQNKLVGALASKPCLGFNAGCLNGQV